jgi:hypothetical protein
VAAASAIPERPRRLLRFDADRHVRVLAPRLAATSQSPASHAAWGHTPWSAPSARRSAFRRQERDVERALVFLEKVAQSSVFGHHDEVKRLQRAWVVHGSVPRSTYPSLRVERRQLGPKVHDADVHGLASIVPGVLFGLVHKAPAETVPCREGSTDSMPK